MKTIIREHPHRHFSRSMAITLALLVFLAVLPFQIRAALFHGISDHPILSGMLLTFGLIALSLVWSVGQQVDAWTFLLFNFRGKRPYWMDRFMLGFTQFGNGVVAMATAVLIFLLDNHHLAYEMILGTLSLWIVVELLKAVFQRSRPFVRLTQTRIVGIRERGRSFPSGHTSQAFFTATLFFQHFHMGLLPVVLIYGVAVGVGITRMYVGAHYPRDVIAGGILGGVWGALGALIDSHFGRF